MDISIQKIIDKLIEKGKELSEKPYEKIDFTKNEEADELLNNIEEFPHAYVLACLMDRQIKAERAWIIPYKISKEIGGFEFPRLLNLDLDRYKVIFNEKKLHRFNNDMAEIFFSGIQKIHNDYSDNASNIWANNPKSATVVRRFLEFKGAGAKIATMAANILAREFKIPMQDKICIDISPDTHVRMVFSRLGLISKTADEDELIYCARELNPDYPGIFDLSCWVIGKKWCKAENPDCQHCGIGELCPKKI